MTPSPKRFKHIDRKACSLLTRRGVISCSLAQSKRRRTIAISVADSMEVSVAAPSYVTEKEIRSFIFEKADWVIEKLEEAKRAHRFLQRKQYEDGHEFLFLGKKYTLKVLEKDISRPQIDFDVTGWRIQVPRGNTLKERRALIKKKLIQWYRLQASEIFGGRVFHFSRILGMEPLKISIRTQKRIWGSCGYHDKNISLNWQLVMSLMEVVDYVIVHELCHLKIPSHSRRYWKKVEKILPNYKSCQRWLKVNRLDMILP